MGNGKEKKKERSGRKRKGKRVRSPLSYFDHLVHPWPDDYCFLIYMN